MILSRDSCRLVISRNGTQCRARAQTFEQQESTSLIELQQANRGIASIQLQEPLSPSSPLARHSKLDDNFFAFCGSRGRDIFSGQLERRADP
jgi:hypothetical protein